jgi:alpha-D-xyloside xylohydrolase
MTGGQMITGDAPLNKIPIYARTGSIVALGPSVQSASARTDPIDLRIYAGADADFTLYEDEGDNYNYERGSYSLIPIHWDDKAQMLTIGDRHGSFPGMLEHKTFRFMRVTDSRGIGITPDTKFDGIVEFTGNANSVRVVPQSR